MQRMALLLKWFARAAIFLVAIMCFLAMDLEVGYQLVEVVVFVSHLNPCRSHDIVRLVTFEAGRFCIGLRRLLSW